MFDRRTLILAGALGPFSHARAQDEASAIALLRAGGVVAAFRHAYAPGTFDPPEFRLNDCSTQRNLDDSGRDQARRLGAWFTRHGLRPAAVRSSPWCRCMDTARLAFGDDAVAAWPALGSVRESQDQAAQAAQVAQLRDALGQVPSGRFEVWVSHQFTLGALVSSSTASGEGLLLRAAAAAGEAPRILARLAPA